MTTAPRRLVVGISGASGATMGVRALELLRLERPDVETHLVLTRGARATLRDETDLTSRQVMELADVVHSDDDLGAPIASGSYPVTGMLVVPCSIKTLSSVANCYSANLLARAADVQLKERRPLVLAVRETPLHRGHLRLMADAADAGAVIFPPVPAFYHRPHSVQDLVDHSVRRMLEAVGLPTPGQERWNGHGVAPEHVRLTTARS
ncbi:UbiX family flavin prenyltransferase [Litorihabitans aurantiacus]|uniref:Flavin prenyltransferase UbiX n=1 Tax=Litorihabitans aurantiacus TaxID=1930061 RepID=A0AA37UUH2_9MICO|nr:UbiX family flavin prenyltransferase [Litorihabitans aurantiacus]GMA30501.1 flavin prenyltransferase UbiX [Litorihabitans aurantiacus]